MPKLPTPRGSLLGSHTKITTTTLVRLGTTTTTTVTYLPRSSGPLRRVTTWTPPARRPAAAATSAAAVADAIPKPPPQALPPSSSATKDQVYPLLDKHREAFRDPATGRPLSAFQWRVYDAIFTDVRLLPSSSSAPLAAS